MYLQLKLSLGVSVAAGLLMIAEIAHPQIAKSEPQKILLRTREIPLDIKPGKVDLDELSQRISTSISAKEGVYHTIVHTKRLLTAQQRETIRRQGVTLISYIPNFGWTAAVPITFREKLNTLQKLGIFWSGPIKPEDKLSRAVRNLAFSDVSLDATGMATALVQFHPRVSDSVAIDIIKNAGGTPVSFVRLINTFTVQIPKDRLRGLADADSIRWIDLPLPALSPLNDLARKAVEVESLQGGPTGVGVRIFVYDAGLVDSDHPDFLGRLTWIGSGDLSDHATHVAGTVGGDGSASTAHGGQARQWRGVAPGVQILSAQHGGGARSLYTSPSDVEQAYTDAINKGIHVANNSIGSNIAPNGFPCEYEGDYTPVDQLIDKIIRGELGKPIVLLWAAGNERSGRARCGKAYRTIPPPSGAKNHITVGATYSENNEVADFSSWGPTDDGRLKPTVVAPGCHSSQKLRSTIPGGGYGEMCGTSMATPVVTGVVSLMLEEYRKTPRGKSDPLASTVRAILIQTARDLGDPGPDYKYGYGLVDAMATIDSVKTGKYLEAKIDQGARHTYRIVVPSSAKQVKVSLAWDDPAGEPSALQQLVNDLDLMLLGPDGKQYLPWILEPTAPFLLARQGRDSLNNQEQVSVDNPAPGQWTIIVNGTRVVEPPQTYSLAVSHPLIP